MSGHRAAAGEKYKPVFSAAGHPRAVVEIGFLMNRGYGMAGRKLAVLALLLVGWRAIPSLAQTTDGGIRVSAFIEPREIPQNRTAQLTIRLEWSGDLDRYEITRFDNPLVQNLEIIGTASANKVTALAGGQLAQQDYQYTLKPEGLGMGYADGIIIRYADAETKKEYRLYTNRLEVKVIEPVAEPGSYRWIFYLAVLLAALAVLVYWILSRRQLRREQLRLERERLAAVVSPEEQYKKLLREQIPLANADLSITDGLGALSRLLRQYLVARWQVPAMELVTPELVQILKSRALPARMVGDVEMILSTSDAARFSGGGDRATLEQLYTCFESILEEA